MRVLHTFKELKDIHTPIHWAAGFFDGVHLGHRRVILSANTPGALRGVLTFAPHPLAVLRPELAPKLLTPHHQQKLQLLEELGVDVLLELPFNHELAALSAEDFINTLCSTCNISGISVGDNWHFGKGGVGNAEFLRAQAAKHGFNACVNNMFLLDGEVVCSTRIRELLADGKPEQAAAMLGRPYTIFGPVEHGQKLARKLGFPTANIAIPTCSALPRAGVYAVSAAINGQVYHGIANLGMRPTIVENIKIPRLETHFPSYSGPDFYGRYLEVQLLHFIRDERKFPSVDALKCQIQNDILSLNNSY